MHKLLQILSIFAFLLACFITTIYTIKGPPPEDPRLTEVKVQTKITEVLFYSEAKKWVFIGSFSLLGICLLMVSIGIYHKKSVHVAKVGKYSAIPVQYRDLPSLSPVLIGLATAENLKAYSQGEQKAFDLYCKVAEVNTQQIQALVGRKCLISRQPAITSATDTSALPSSAPVPTFAELLQNGTIARGKSLVLGYSQGQPQYRSLKALKSVAIAGWQGSGKTLSTAYMIASSIISYGIRVYIIDPHKEHVEGLYHIIQPLESAGLVNVVNPFYIPQLIRDLNAVLDRRLKGQESSEQGILLVIDELARLARLEVFETLIHFIERCTEEARKANMTFFGCSQTWTARHFKGRANIRGCMNSMLVHKTKPSQADLLLEDSQDKKLVKQLEKPGDAILVTDYEKPCLVSMPLCTRQDMECVARKLGEQRETAAVQNVSNSMGNLRLIKGKKSF